METLALIHYAKVKQLRRNGNQDVPFKILSPVAFHNKVLKKVRDLSRKIFLGYVKEAVE